MFKGRSFVFFGAYAKKSKAKAAERKHPGSFVKPRKIKSHLRYVVMKERR